MEKEFQSVMDRLMFQNKGFTMIETLFVLFIITMLLSLTFSLHIPKKNVDTQIQEIKAFLNSAKIQAMVTKDIVKVTFTRNKITYDNQQYVLSDDSYFDSYEMTFNENGNIKTAKSLTYHTPKKDYTFVYQVGSGCFYVQ